MHNLEQYAWDSSSNAERIPSDTVWSALAAHCKRLSTLNIVDDFVEAGGYAPAIFSTERVWTCVQNLKRFTYVLQEGWVDSLQADHMWFALVNGCPDLLQLRTTFLFESYAVDTTSLFSSPKLWPNLTVLVLRGLVFDPAAFNEFLKHHLSMEKLSVGWDVDLPPIDFETLSSNALPALQHFSFHGLRGEHVLPLLAYGRPLRELRGFAMRSEQDEPETVDGTEPLNFLTKLVDAKLPLQKLELEEWEGDRRANLALLARAVGETLVWLDLGSCLSTGKPDVPVDLSGFPRLETLLGIKLPYAPDGLIVGVDSFLHALAESAPSLKHVSYHRSSRAAEDVATLIRAPDGGLMQEWIP